MASPVDVNALFIERSRSYMSVEYRTKLRESVEALPADALWARPNEQSNSVGNLLLHLMGNVRQWIVSGVGGTPDTRNRVAEFATHEGESASELLARMDALLDEVDRVLAALSPADLSTGRTIQGRDVTVFDAIYQVVQHFSQHLGQIIWIAKLHAPGAVVFVDGTAAATALWKQKIRQRQA